MSILSRKLNREDEEGKTQEKCYEDNITDKMVALLLKTDAGTTIGIKKPKRTI